MIVCFDYNYSDICQEETLTCSEIYFPFNITDKFANLGFITNILKSNISLEDNLNNNITKIELNVLDNICETPEIYIYASNISFILALPYYEDIYQYNCDHISTICVNESLAHSLIGANSTLRSQMSKY